MKRIALVFGIIISVSIINMAAQNAGQPSLEKPGTVTVKWDKIVYDFGKVKHNNPATAKYVVKNTGDKAVVIYKVDKSCGCTTPKYPKEPIQPGDSAVIQATYNAKNLGSFTKYLTVHLNTEMAQQRLTLKGTVVK